MVRLLVRNEWYEALSSNALYEHEFESILIERAESLFPRFYLVGFKTLVCSDAECRQPDLALIDREFREWWVVEIELGHHDFDGHVLPQVITLSSADYQTAAVLHDLHRELPRVPKESVRDLLRGTQPRVLVIANKRNEQWVEALGLYDALLITIELYRSDKNDLTLGLDGDVPAKPADFVSICHPAGVIPRLIEVEAPAALRVAHSEHLTIRFEGGITDWERIDIGRKVFLNPVHRNPVHGGSRFALTRGGDGILELRRA